MLALALEVLLLKLQLTLPTMKLTGKRPPCQMTVV